MSAAQDEKIDVIENGKTYKLADFRAITELGLNSMRRIRARCEELGITLVRYEGRRAYVRGDDWHEYLGHTDSTR